MEETPGPGELVEVVAPRLDEVVSRAAERALGEIPEYARSIDLDELREGIRRDLGLAMAALVEGRELTEVDRETMSLIGEARAEQGLPIEGMVRVYRLTIDEVFRVIHEAAETRRLGEDDALALIRSAWHYGGRMVEGAVGAYRRREVELAVADSERRSELVRSLLLSPRGAPAGLVAAIGLDPAARYLAIRARGTDGDTRSLRLDLGMPGALEGGLVAVHEGDVIGFATAPPALAPGDAAVVAVGPTGRLAELARSFVVASRVLEAAVAFGRSGVVALDSLTLEALARGDDLVGDELVSRYVEALEPHSPVGAEIVETLEAFLGADLSAERAAEALGVHPNTVRNRLRRFEQITDASLRSVRSLTEIRLALLRASL